jgi:hypothetical protein
MKAANLGIIEDIKATLLFAHYFLFEGSNIL